MTNYVYHLLLQTHLQEKSKCIESLTCNLILGLVKLCLPSTQVPTGYTVYMYKKSHNKDTLALSALK